MSEYSSISESRRERRVYHFVPSGNNEAKTSKLNQFSRSLSHIRSEIEKTHVGKDLGERTSALPVPPRLVKQRQPSGPSRYGFVRIES